MEITRKSMESLAKELNKVLGLEPQIDVKKTSDEELAKQLVQAGTIVVPGQDAISDKGMDLLAALSSAKPEKPAKETKTKTQAGSKGATMNTELIEQIETAKKLSELKAIAQGMSNDIKKMAEEAKGLQAAIGLKKAMIAEATWSASGSEAKKAKKAKAEAPVEVAEPEAKKAKKAALKAEEPVEQPKAKKAKAEAPVEVAEEQVAEANPNEETLSALKSDKSFQNTKKVWKGSEVLQAAITLKALNAAKEDPKALLKLRKQMIAALTLSEKPATEEAPNAEKATKKPKILKTESTGSRSNPKYGKATRELYVKLADMIKEGKHDKTSITNTLTKQFGVDPKKVGFLLSFAKNPQHTRCGVVAVIDSKGIFKLSKEKAVRPLKALK